MQRVRIATFNIWELGADKLATVNQAGHGADIQLRNAAEIIQRVRPDILLVNEIDFDVDGQRNARTFRTQYLEVGQGGQPAIELPYEFFESVNTGVATGKDLDNDGRSDGPADAYGFGRYPGQYGMALFSRFEIDRQSVRTFRNLLWKDMPGNLMPDGRDGRPAWYSVDEASILRLSSKSHWDIPVRIGDTVVHLLCAHPTPPVFDGPEDWNGRRNFDEIRFWADYISGGRRADYIVDDLGQGGGLPPAAHFIVVGDLNADPVKSDALYGMAAIDQLLKHEGVFDPKPTSSGAAAGNKPGPPDFPERRTCDFGRLDYVLPSSGLTIAASGVFWPDGEDPLQRLVAGRSSSSDHRLVWVDVVLPGRP